MRKGERAARAVVSRELARHDRTAPDHGVAVESESLTDVGAVAPLLGGEGVRYDPLPERLVSQRRRLAFVYHDGRRVERLDFRASPPAARRNRRLQRPPRASSSSRSWTRPVFSRPS
jgi:hypothetical protein